MVYKTYEIQDVPRRFDPYCPYCNQDVDEENLTEEHVIPQCVSKISGLVIGVCKTCNSTMGHSVDSLLLKDSYLRMISIRPGNVPTASEQHPSTAKLKDGTELEGYFAPFFGSDSGWRPGFRPMSTQPNGTKWVHENAVPDVTKLPDHISVFRQEDIETASILIRPSAKLGMERAFIKIFLGFIYLVWGHSITCKASFDSLRSVLKGNHEEKVWFWWDQDQKIDSPDPIQFGHHYIWGGSVRDRNSAYFKGGVSLYGKRNMQILLEDFEHHVPGRQVRAETPWARRG